MGCCALDSRGGGAMQLSYDTEILKATVVYIWDMRLFLRKIMDIFYCFRIL